MAKRVHSSNSSLDTAEIVRGARLIQQLHQTTVDWGRLHRWLAESCLRTGQRRAALGQLALAAVHGQSKAVAGDVMTIVRRRLNRRNSTVEPAAASDTPWGGERVQLVRGRER